MRGHADAAMLAAFREELLSARKAAQVSAHLATCPRCAALEAQLAEVTTLLNRATAPPMPDALTARIQAALAAEAAARTEVTAPHAAPAPAAVPALSGAAVQGAGEAGGGRQDANGHRAGQDAGRRAGWRGHDRSWLALRVAAVTAAVAVIAGGGYGVAQLLSGNTGAHGAAATGAAAGPNLKVKGSGAVPGMSAGGGNVAPAPGSGGSSASSAGTPVISSGTNYQPTSLGAQASAVLRRQTRIAHSSAGTVPTPALPQNQASLFPHLQACLVHIGNGQRPRLADLAHYLSHPALIVVLPGINGARPQALVIAPGCTGTTDTVLAKAPLPRSS